MVNGGADLHRFLGVRAGRKYRYAELMAQALDLRATPDPLAGLVEALR